MIKKYLIFLISIYGAVNCMEVNEYIDMNVTQVAIAQIIDYNKEENSLKVRLSKESSDRIAAILQANIELKVEDGIRNSVLIKSIKEIDGITLLCLENQFNHEFKDGQTVDILAKNSDKEEIDLIDSLLLIESHQTTTTSGQSAIYDSLNDVAFVMSDAYENTLEPEESLKLGQMNIDQAEEKGDTTETDDEYLADGEYLANEAENSDIEYFLVDDNAEQEKKSEIEVEENPISEITNLEKKNVAEKSIEKKKKSYTCDYAGCGKDFSSASILNRHKRVHTGEKPYACDYAGCGKSFAQAGNLQIHKRVHVGEKPYVCDHAGCGKSFSDLSNLKRHKGIHTSEKRYACDYAGCGKSFSDVGNFQRHKRVHTGEKPYTCDCEGCGKSFSTTSGLRRHKKTHVKRKADTELENKTELKKRRKK